MIKAIVILSICIELIMAVELELRPEQNITITPEDKRALKEYVQERYHFIMNDDGVGKIVRENRVLANEFLRKGLLSSYEKNKIRIEIEKQLADKMVEDFQRKTKLSDDILKSYYKDHRNQFKKDDEVKLVSYRFSNYQDAVAFYNRKDRKYKEKNELGWKSINSFNPRYRSFIRKNQKGYCLPPLILGKDAFEVLCIEDYKNNEGKYQPFTEVKKQIEDILRKKTFSRERAKLLEQYQ